MPSAADVVLAGRPNVLVHPPPHVPALPARRPRSRVRTPRPLFGVRDGAPVHLQDVAELILEEWAAVPAGTISHCWAKACILPLAVEARALAEHGEYCASVRGIAEDVPELLSLMGASTVAQSCLGASDRAERELAVEGWLGLVGDPLAIEDTVDNECRAQGAYEEG